MANENQYSKDQLIDDILFDITGQEGPVEAETLQQTISNVLKDYNLSTNADFIEKVAKLKFTNNGKTEEVAIEALPTELKEAAFLPVNTIADIALRQDLDMVISQIPEWFTALTVTRDAVCEADVVTGKLSRTITFDHEKEDETKVNNTMSTIEEVEERLDLHSIIKNHCVFNTLEYGEGYAYVIPYAKVFQDLYRYRLNNGNSPNSSNRSVANMFDTSPVLSGMGYSESAVEVTLRDKIIEEAVIEKRKEEERIAKDKNRNKSYKRNIGDVYTEQAGVSISEQLFTEAEVMNLYPLAEPMPANELPLMMNESARNTIHEKEKEKHMTEFDKIMDNITRNIRYISEDIALPVIEESAHDLRAVYQTKYHDVYSDDYMQEMTNFFSEVMDDNQGDSGITKEFRNIKGVYIRILPATKLIPIRIDRIVIGYYYISDLTRPEQAGERRNSGLSGYTLKSPSIGYDSFSPDQMFCERLANKIINNFDLKFMHDNASLYQQIVAILEQHKFNEAMLRFVFIPAEHVQQFTINKDGIGKGHSMLEPGLVTARMYMFLKLYSILYQINNSQIRVYNVRQSGMDKNYRQFVQQVMKKFADRRITASDIFNYRSSIPKVSGSSELILPMGTSDKPPVTFETIEAASAPINNELLENLKNEAINATPVPSAMVQGAMSELDFAKEVELANTRFMSMVSSYKIDFNNDITKMYRKILRWETDLEPDLLKTLRFSLQMPTAKTLSVTSDMIGNFNSLKDLIFEIFLTKQEQKEKDGDTENSGVVREYAKLLLEKFIPGLDVDMLEELADKARKAATANRLKKQNSEENILGTQAAENEEGMMM